MSYSVGELAKLAGVSVRTLHHYDDVGLLPPSERTSAGYRQYGEADVERLHRILVYRALGFDLAGIARILDEDAVDATEQLRRQHALLVERLNQLEGMKRGVEKMMESRRSGGHLTPDEMREVFGDFDPAEHAAEAEERWGETDAYRESRRRASSYGKAEWQAIQREAAEINEAFAAAMQAGEPASSADAMAIAERHRRHISHWFYDCTPEIHRGLAAMYTGDARFTQHYEDVAAGLARYVHDAVVANAERVEQRSSTGGAGS